MPSDYTLKEVTHMRKWTQSHGCERVKAIKPDLDSQSPIPIPNAHECEECRRFRNGDHEATANLMCSTPTARTDCHHKRQLTRYRLPNTNRKTDSLLNSNIVHTENHLKSVITSSRSLLVFAHLLVILIINSSFNQHGLINAQFYGEPSTTASSITESNFQAQQAAASQQQQTPAQAESNPQSTTTTNAACFGGLQTFEKISMSSFESPAGGSSNVSSEGGGSFGSGILVQQDDQALTSECINLCRSQSNCLSFVIDYNKFECKSYATTQQELQQEFAAKFQAARAVTSGNGSQSDSTEPNSSGGYQAAASFSAPNFQQLLPSASSNYFEKICLDGVANRNQFSDVCGQGRLWTIERVVDSYLDGFVEKEVTNVNNKDECSKLCIFETQFVCRSADYDPHSRLCRLSKEDRRTQPQAMRYVANSNRQYLENQCATPGPSSCVYETKRNVGIISMDALKFAQTVQDCQMKCNQETTFNCRSYSFHQQRCFLSGDDSVSLNSNLIKLPQKQGWAFGEKKCLVELCTKGIFSYEKITGFALRSALSTSIDLMMPGSSELIMRSMGQSSSGGVGNLDGLQIEASQTRLRRLLPPPSAGVYHIQANGTSFRSGSSSSAALAAAMMSMMMPSSAQSNSVTNSNIGNMRQADPLHVAASGRHTRSSSSNLAITEHCRHSCDLGYLNCPAFTIDYKNNRCQRLDRNSQGRHQELMAREGFAYYEKICLRVPEIMSMCRDKYWIFERVIGYELAPRLYDKSLKFVQSRRDCEEYCLEEKQFQCRSALYNDETSDCKLSRYDRRLAQQEGGYQRNFNVRISYLENNCVRDHQLDKKQSCYYEQAKDEPAYPTFTERIEMAAPAAEQQPGDADFRPLSPSGLHHMALHGHNNQNQNYTNSQAGQRYGSSYCEQLCNDNSKFECHSFGYYASTAQCFLSGDDSISAGEMATTPSTGFTYYEKKCRPSMLNDSSPETNEAPQGSGLGGGGSTTPSSLNPYITLMHHQGGNMQSSGGSTTVASDPQADFPSRLTTPSSNSVPFQDQNGYSNNNMRPSSMPLVPQGGMRPVIGVPSSNETQMDPDLYKCGLGHSFVYQRISGFEPIGGYLTLLLKNNEQPGIVADCSELCRRAFECRAFVVDYNSNQCYAMLENSSVGLLSLRQTLGKDYFEGFCVPNHLLLSTSTGAGSNCRNKTWVMDKIVDQAVFGVQHQKLIQDSDRLQCRRACLEERLFLCKSAMFDSSTGDCKLYSIDRESIPQMRLIFTKGVDFFENQCQIMSSACPYDAIERDMTIITITKSIQARSTFDCELACNSETGFNCRSYTYLDQYPSLPNLCLLSSDSRSTSQRGSVREHQKTLYAERNCYYRRPRIPSGKYDQPSYSPPFVTSSPPINPLLADPYQPTPPTITDAMAGPSSPSELPPFHTSTEKFAHFPPRISSTEQEGSPLANPYDVVGPALGQAGCEPHQHTFERTFGYDFKLTPKERAPIAPMIGIAVGCQQECLRRGDKCQSFVVDYALPYQSCFLIESSVGANKRLLIKSPNSAYFEKVCLPRTGLVVDPAEPLMSHGPMQSPFAGQPMSDPAQSLDISPSYSQEPWSVQAAQQQNHQQHLPYHLQQQQLVQNYPSRSCPKLWTFERFVNHNFTAPVDKVVENSLTRAHCETECLNEASFSCRAATYDYSNKICRLFKNTRRTIMSQFMDLDSPNAGAGSMMSSSNQVGLASPALPNSHPGTAHVLDQGSDSIQTAASSTPNQDLTGTNNKRQTGARQLQLQQAVTAEPTNPSRHNIDYLENTCTPEPSSCQYRQIYDQFSPYIDKVNHAVSLNDCQRQCDQERLFSCKSINYDVTSRNCMLVNEDLISLARGGQSSSASSPLLPKRNTIYSEKGNCEMISVQCNSQEMLVAINFDSPFRGRVMAKGNPEQCYVLGDGQTSLQFSIVFGPKCNSRQEGHNTFVNEVVIQQHPVIMTESDKTVRVMCAFEAPDQTITLKNPSSRDNKTGIDVGTPDSSRTRHDKQQFNSVVSNKAPPPSVMLRILDQSGRDASMINLGDDVMLKIQMQMVDGKSSALGIFARNLAARSSNGESLMLIDNEGCPVDPQVFPALEIDQKDGRSLYSTFKAFRFPSSGLVNFEVQIRFCPERCQPIDCHHKSLGQHTRSRSYGRKKRQVDFEGNDPSRAPILQSVSDSMASSAVYQQQEEAKQALVATPVALDSLSTVMKPGKAFEYVRKLMLPQMHVKTESEQPPLQYPELNGGGEADEATGQYVTSKETTSQQDFDSFSAPASEAGTREQVTVPEGPTLSQGLTVGHGQGQFSQPDYSQRQGNVVDNYDHFVPLTAPTVEQMPVSGQVHQKSVQMKVGEGESQPPQPTSNLPDTPTATETSTYKQQVKLDSASYNSFQPSSIQVEPQRPASEGNPQVESIAKDPDELIKNGTAAEDDNNEHDLMLNSGQRQSNLNLEQDRQKLLSQMPNSKDMPLRFSILVGENQLPTADVSQGQPPTIMNSTRMELDHIVIPGKKGQFEENDSTSSNSLSSPSSIGDLSYPTTPSNQQQDVTTTDGRGRTRETNKRNASYEQTFDALPSNSVPSEVHIDHRHHHQQQYNAPNQQDLMRNHRQQQQQMSSNRQQTSSSSESAASHDCQVESGRSRLRAIIWTGGIVISLNVCLVILSLVLYFRKLHSRQNHTIVRSPSDCVTSRSDGLGGLGNGGSTTTRLRGGHWPKVVLKSKNKLGTSLNTHEHFFCKLNSKPSGISNSALEHDFNWPNLSSSSSRSTISSLASPVPSTSIRINQMRPSLKSSPFDAHSTLRSGNFIPGHETHKGQTIMDDSDNEGEYPARYTNNIDVLRSERF